MAKKSKKMTKKQFVEIFEKAGMNFEIWGYEGILNFVIMAQRHMERDCKERGWDDMASEHAKRAEIIFAELEKIGYFE